MINTKFSVDWLRTLWIDFFKSKKHYLLESASLVPVEDPSLLWINSGVATLKPYFEGKKTPPAFRLVNCQKAIRTNDIENVGITARHHTFFEMLGNFSIGDYFKREAITWGWEFLTSEKWLNLDKNKLYITVFSEDKEAYDIWLNEIKVQKNHIIKGTRETNFWDMGQGPCGPNTEIYYDRGKKYDSENKGIELLIKDIENDRYIEIWNIVFSQFNNDGNNNYTDLPRKNIDTGAGLERIASILQNVPTNFDIDSFQFIIKECEKMTNFKYDINNYFENNEQQKEINIAFKIISDHIRCLSFAISDGVFPGSKNRGYILRRLIRRAEVYGQKLNINDPFLYKLVPSVVDIMKKYYPELKEKVNLIANVVKTEEIKFWKTLLSGKELLLKIIEKEQTISGANAFRLFEAFGYPIELTIEIAAEHKVEVDVDGFFKLLENHKINARNARENVQALSKQNPLLTNLKINSKFVGYEQNQIDSKINFLFIDEQKTDSITNEKGFLILEKTPFYAEKGGQAADGGFISTNNGYGKILDVQSGPNNTNIHYLEVNGKIKLGDIVHAEIDQEKRFYTMKNHSGTHLLHAALRKILGNHVMQIGSFNNQEYLRLDFSHFQKIEEEDLINLENQVQQWIECAANCEIYHVSYEDALKMNALAFFGEKYDGIVRVVKFGEFSIELCGGTHCLNSKDVEQLLITSVESKGSGSYRIQALTSFKTINEFLIIKINEIKTQAQHIYEKYQDYKNKNADIESMFQQIKTLKYSKEEWRIARKIIINLQNTFKIYEKNINIQKEINDSQKYLHLKPELINEKNILINEFNNLNVSALKNLSDHFRNLYENIIIVFLNHLDEHNTLILVSTNTTESASDILKKILLPYNGKGGGNNTIAQGKINKKLIKKDIIL